MRSRPTKAPVKALSDKQIAKFVESGAGNDKPHTPTIDSEALTRLPVYLPKGLHRRFKIACMMTGVSMAREVREFIERRTAELEANK